MVAVADGQEVHMIKLREKIGRNNHYYILFFLLFFLTNLSFFFCKAVHTNNLPYLLILTSVHVESAGSVCAWLFPSGTLVYPPKGTRCILFGISKLPIVYKWMYLCPVVNWHTIAGCSLLCALSFLGIGFRLPMTPHRIRVVDDG